MITDKSNVVPDIEEMGRIERVVVTYANGSYYLSGCDALMWAQMCNTQLAHYLETVGETDPGFRWKFKPRKPVTKRGPPPMTMGPPARDGRDSRSHPKKAETGARGQCEER